MHLSGPPQSECLSLTERVSSNVLFIEQEHVWSVSGTPRAPCSSCSWWSRQMLTVAMLGASAGGAMILAARCGFGSDLSKKLCCYSGSFFHELPGQVRNALLRWLQGERNASQDCHVDFYDRKTSDMNTFLISSAVARCQEDRICRQRCFPSGSCRI